jgi:hypothetical protein
MSKYRILIGTSLIILLAFFMASTRNVSAQIITTGDASTFSCAVNLVNTYSNYLPWFNANCHFTCNSDHMCIVVAGEGTNQCSTNSDCQTPSETPTPTPTPTPTTTPSNPGGPGDGRSDNLGCGSHDCSSHPSAPQGQVLGLSSTSGEENYLLQIVQALGALTSVGLGFVFLKK